MKNNRFSEPEQFLMGKWADVELLKQSIKSIGDKYRVICDEVCDIVREKYPKLDYSSIRPDYENGRGTIGIGKRVWPSMYDGWPNGFYVEDFGLVNLTSEEEGHPSACIWLKPPISLGFDLSNAGKRVRREAKQLMTPEQLTACHFEEDKWACLWYSLPESRQRLLEMLLKDQAGEFVECLVSHFEVLTKFIPVIDDLFQTAEKRKPA